MEPIRIVDVFQFVERRNPISGHRWAERGKHIGYEVCGGRWIRQFHRTLDAAEQDKAIKESINRKFPYVQ
jgi:hypothetical protein